MNAADRNITALYRDQVENEAIILQKPLSSADLESRLFQQGLGNKPELSEAIQDTARNIVNK